MNKLTLAIALTVSSLTLAACAEDADDTAVSDDVGAAPAEEVEVTLPTTMPEADAPANPAGDRVRIGPDGAEIDVEDGGTKVKVDTKNPSLEVEVD